MICDILCKRILMCQNLIYSKLSKEALKSVAEHTESHSLLSFTDVNMHVWFPLMRKYATNALEYLCNVNEWGFGSWPLLLQVQRDDFHMMS